MSNNSEINWRDASEDEFEYIKKKYLSPMVAVTVGNAFVFLLIVATVAFLIYCNTKKHDIKNNPAFTKRRGCFDCLILQLRLRLQPLEFLESVRLLELAR